MKVHHLNCGTMCPFGVGEGSVFGRFVCHCLLVETNEGLVLIDTGLGRRDIEQGLGRLFEWSCRPKYDMHETAAAQVEALGFAVGDVRHIVVTHLDLDHAGGLAEFPNACVHVHAREREASLRRGLNARMRYVPRQWAHDVSWRTYTAQGEAWLGFEAIRALEGVSDEVLMVPLPGHSQGHCGVAVRRDDGGWLLHCGDAFFHRHQIDPSAGRVPLGIRLFQNSMVADWRARNRNIRRLSALHHKQQQDVKIFCAHDARSLERLREASNGG